MQSTGGSVVEFSPATRETGVRFPASAIFFLFFFLSNLLCVFSRRCNNRHLYHGMILFDEPHNRNTDLNQYSCTSIDYLWSPSHS